MSNTKACTKCGQIKESSEFGNHAGRIDGKSSYCLTCARIARAEYRKRQSINIKKQQADNYQRNRAKRIEAARLYVLNLEHRKKKNESNKRWQTKNKALVAFYSRKRRMRLIENKRFIIRKKDLIKLYASACIYCGSLNRIEADHVIPVSRSGSDGIGNLVPACKKCNTTKQDLFIMEWRIKTLKR